MAYLPIPMMPRTVCANTGVGVLARDHVLKWFMEPQWNLVC